MRTSGRRFSGRVSQGVATGAALVGLFGLLGLVSGCNSSSSAPSSGGSATPDIQPAQSSVGSATPDIQPAQSSVGSATPDIQPAQSSVGSPAQGAPSAQGVLSSSAIREVDDTANGSTVHVRVGDAVRVTLHSTYWEMNAPSSSAVQAGASDVVASPPGPGRIPGSGAGTVVTSYIAHSIGTAQITAHRTSCGEALLCPPDKQSYTVTIAVDAR